MSAAEDALRLALVERLLRLPGDRLAEVEALLTRLQADPNLVATPSRMKVTTGNEELHWPHAPPHRLSEHGTVFVTAGTLHKEHHFREARRLDHLHAALLSRAQSDGWQLEAWAVFSNHYHFVAHALEGAVPLG